MKLFQFPGGEPPRLQLTSDQQSADLPMEPYVTTGILTAEEAHSYQVALKNNDVTTLAHLNDLIKQRENDPVVQQRVDMAHRKLVEEMTKSTQ